MKRKFEVAITRTGTIIIEAETADEAFDKVLEMATADIDKNADGNLTGWEPSDVVEVGTNEYADANFINDKEKMRDFKELSKEEFLSSYSYLTKQEYDNTAREMLKKLYERLKQIDDELTLEYEDGETCWAANLEAEYEQTEELICKIESEIK